MDPLVLIAEEKIREAMARGEFDNLPGAGKPLVLEDDSMVPEDLRVSYKILKNAGCLPPELELRKEIVSLKSLLSAIEEEGEKRRKLKELDGKLLRLNLMRKRPLQLEDFPEYRDRVIEKLTG
ncbi:MAG TPA: DnaJ family domain-containing protein [Candidatus Limnocylindrales bacterium]|nr:DnaJ family domain-containing protein [Candidatus Limnocylindrales bacterium]